MAALASCLPGGWDIIAISAETNETVELYLEWFKRRQRIGKSLAGVTPKTQWFPIPQPTEVDLMMPIGSGNAFLNAVLFLTERLSLEDGHSSLTSRVYSRRRVLLLLCESRKPKDLVSLAHLWGPLSPLSLIGINCDDCVCPVELCLHNLQDVADLQGPPGIWVSTLSGVARFTSPKTVISNNQLLANGITTFSVVDKSLSTSENKEFSELATDAFFPPEVLEPMILSGLSPEMAEATFYASAGQPQLNLCFDADVLGLYRTEKHFCNGFEEYPKQKAAVECLKRQLQNVAVKTVSLPESSLWTRPDSLNGYVNRVASASTKRHRYLLKEDPEKVMIGPNAVVEFCELESGCIIGERSFVHGAVLDSGTRINPGTYVQTFCLRNPADCSEFCTVVLSMDDCVVSDRFFGIPFADHFKTGPLTPDLLGISPNDPRGFILWKAALFPVASDPSTSVKMSLWLQHRSTTDPFYELWRTGLRMSLSDIFQLVTTAHHLAHIDSFVEKTDKKSIVESLTHSPSCITQALERRVIQTIDNVADRDAFLDWFDVVLSGLPTAQIGRGLSMVADSLALFAGPFGGFRNPFTPHFLEDWKAAFDCIGANDLPTAVMLMHTTRNSISLSTSSHLMMAARHYDKAASLVTALHVGTAAEFVVHQPLPQSQLVTTGSWVSVHSPARIDMAGGWTDTPPISFEEGGVVINAAVLLDGNRPIRAHVRRLVEMVLRLWIDGMDTPLECTQLVHIRDYCNPMATAALLKAALVCVNIVDVGDEAPELSEQLGNGISGGLEIKVQCDLPVGSGLGTSSILGGTLIKAIGLAIGRNYDNDSLVHAVLRLEQLLTTGGGWQDQVGGLFPGVKKCSSKAQLPLCVTSEVIPLRSEFLGQLSEHLVLIYTGKARLARNLLQNVLRRWASRLPEIVAMIAKLKQTASELENALRIGDIANVGQCLSAYWEQKKCMAAGGVEPVEVTHAIEVLSPYLYGASLAGAGGGGFMVCVTKEPRVCDSLKAVLLKDNPERYVTWTFHRVTIDEGGPGVSVKS